MSDMLRNMLFEMASKAKSVFVFPDPITNKPYKDIKKSFRTACKKAGIEGYRRHDNRHVFSTYAIQNDTDIATLSQILGHQDIETTMRYISPSNETKTRAVNIMGNILSQLEDTDVETLENLEKSRTDLETLEKTSKKESPKKVINLYEYWSGRLDSNQRPRRPERRALPSWATPRNIIYQQVMTFLQYPVFCVVLVLCLLFRRFAPQGCSLL